MAKKKLWQHLAFWALSFLVLFRLFTINYNNGIVDVIFTVLFHIPLLVCVYLNYGFIARFFDKKRYGLYLLATVGNLGLGIMIHQFIFNFLSHLIAPGFYFISYYSFVQIGQFILSYIIISLLYDLSRSWFILKEQQHQLEKEKHQATLGMLKAQLNPHFLFNSLNNIYSISQPENKLARKYLLQLSDALRYMIYETTDEKVKLEREIEYLRNYVGLERLRFENEVHIEFAAEGRFDQFMIAPLLLLPVIENCFKHADKNEPQIDIRMFVKGSTLHVNTSNRRSQEHDYEAGGVGLANVKKRLGLLYKDKFNLLTEETDDHYNCLLQIDLSE